MKRAKSVLLFSSATLNPQTLKSVLLCSSATHNSLPEPEILNPRRLNGREQPLEEHLADADGDEKLPHWHHRVPAAQATHVEQGIRVR